MLNPKENAELEHLEEERALFYEMLTQKAYPDPYALKRDLVRKRMTEGPLDELVQFTPIKEQLSIFNTTNSFNPGKPNDPETLRIVHDIGTGHSEIENLITSDNPDKFELIKMLVEKRGLDVNTVCTEIGETIFGVTMRCGADDITRYLISSKRIDLNTPLKGHNGTCGSIIMKDLCKNINYRNIDGIRFFLNQYPDLVTHIARFDEALTQALIIDDNRPLIHDINRLDKSLFVNFICKCPIENVLNSRYREFDFSAKEALAKLKTQLNKDDYARVLQAAMDEVKKSKGDFNAAFFTSLLGKELKEMKRLSQGDAELIELFEAAEMKDEKGNPDPSNVKALLKKYQDRGDDLYQLKEKANLTFRYAFMMHDDPEVFPYRNPIISYLEGQLSKIKDGELFIEFICKHPIKTVLDNNYKKVELQAKEKLATLKTQLSGDDYIRALKTAINEVKKSRSDFNAPFFTSLLWKELKEMKRLSQGDAELLELFKAAEMKDEKGNPDPSNVETLLKKYQDRVDDLYQLKEKTDLTFRYAFMMHDNPEVFPYRNPIISYLEEQLSKIKDGELFIEFICKHPIEVVLNDNYKKVELQAKEKLATLKTQLGGDDYVRVLKTAIDEVKRSGAGFNGAFFTSLLGKELKELDKLSQGDAELLELFEAAEMKDKNGNSDATQLKALLKKYQDRGDDLYQLTEKIDLIHRYAFMMHDNPMERPDMNPTISYIRTQLSKIKDGKPLQLG